VVIPCYNHGEFVGEAVGSVVGAKREDVELIVVDDGSTDKGTSEEMNKLGAQGIRVIRQENGGLSAARNAGIVASQGEYIFPLDADDRMRSGWIDRGIQILDANPKVGVVYGNAECFGTRTGHWETGPFDPDRMLDMNYIHASALYRRSVWKQNSGYDVTMLHGLEDWDFWLGALEHGWQFSYIPEVFFEYRQAAESMVTRVRGLADQIGDFVGGKHGHLYREAWLRLARERQSATKTGRRLRTLLKARLRQKLSKNPGDLWVNG
jgi:glycosyltransferase involved in cell wall biosynthesis